MVQCQFGNFREEEISVAINAFRSSVTGVAIGIIRDKGEIKMVVVLLREWRAHKEQNGCGRNKSVNYYYHRIRSDQNGNAELIDNKNNNNNIPRCHTHLMVHFGGVDGAWWWLAGNSVT